MASAALSIKLATTRRINSGSAFTGGKVAASSDVYKRQGLGLAIASRIIAEHNGTIRVEDNLPSGARFLIRFPAAEVVVTQAQTGGQA